MKRWTRRIVFLLLGVVILGVVYLAFDYRRWRAESLAAFPASASTVISTARGPVEYTELGGGQPVLEVHGSPGGFDVFYALHKVQYGDAGPPFRAILPSRPGYLRTPLSTGATPAEQADAMAALLDVLHLDRVAVIGLSDAGPSSLQFALRHADRCSALILVSAVTQMLPGGGLPPGAVTLQKILPEDALPYLLQRFLLIGVRRELRNDAQGLAMLDASARTTVPMASRLAGVLNDASQDEQIHDWPLGDIRCPTLVIHGTSDIIVPFAHGENAATRIPGARLVRVEGGDHFALIARRKEIDPAIADFLASHPTR